MRKKILIMGLPGAGKTTLAHSLAPLLNAVIFNADEVRANINRDLGFALEDRIEHGDVREQESRAVGQEEGRDMHVPKRGKRGHWCGRTSAC